jgi:acyl carrier protein
MQNFPPPHHNKCAHSPAGQEPCKYAALDKYEFCRNHLEIRTRENVKSEVITIITDELGVDRSEVTDDARFVDHLGADSLDKVTIVLRFEESFNLWIPDKKADELVTVGAAVNHVIDVKLATGAYMQHPDTAAAAAADSRARKARHTERILKQIAWSRRFLEYYPPLELEADKVERLFQRVVRNDLITHVTPIPVGDDKLTCLHVLLLGESKIYYFKFQCSTVRFEWAALNDLRFAYEMLLDEDKEISKVVVKSSSRDERDKRGHARENLRDSVFEFAGEEEIEGALEFLAKYLVNLEGAQGAIN